jgi:hypothetical protein
MAKKNNVEELMAQAREKMGEKPKVKKEKKKPKTVQEQYTAIKESMTPKVKENINEQELTVQGKFMNREQSEKNLNTLTTVQIANVNVMQGEN